MEYGDELYSWAYYRTSHKESAEDIVQETFISAFQNVNKFEGKSSPKTWLFSILNNKIIDYHRKNVRDIIRPESAVFGESGFSVLELLFDKGGHWKKNLEPLDWTGAEDNLLDNTEFVAALKACMDRLPIAWHSALQLKYLEEKEGSEICQELGISPSNFWQILHRSKLQVRQCLEKEWFKK